MRFKKIDALIIVILIVAAGLFFYKAGYIFPAPQEGPFPPDEGSGTLKPPPAPPASFIPAYKRDVSSIDEGVHFNKIRIAREWWYYTAVFTGEKSELPNWSIAISFNHMARSDLFGTRSPDLLLVTLFSPEGETYGGIINKKRGLGIFTPSTLTAGTPGVKVKFEDSWAEGQYPDWHVHAEGDELDTSHQLIIDLDYHANSTPVWTIGNRILDESKSTIANYLFTGCEVTGSITIDGKTYNVKGGGHHEHSWTPHYITRASLNGWDWFHMMLTNGWEIYLSNYYPLPQFISTKTSRINQFGTIFITTDKGKTFTELKNIDIKITRQDNRILPFIRMPAAFTVNARPSWNPLYLESQSLLFGTDMKLKMDITLDTAYNKVWKFPTYVGMKVGMCSVTGTLSWSDGSEQNEVSLDGIGVSWSMRALL